MAIACINSLYSQMVLPIAFDSSNIANYDELVNECIEPLDKSLISSGILGEKGFLFVDLDRFNGQTDSVITTPPMVATVSAIAFCFVITNEHVLP